MKKNIVCNFAVIRFRPYPETDEFVNIGIVLTCPKLHFFDFEIEHKRKRVTDFFPELNSDVFEAAKKAIKNELLRLKSVNADQLELAFSSDEYKRLFVEVTKFKEGIMVFSNIKTILTDNPKTELKKLFDYYIERQFVSTKPHYEFLMKKRLTRMFDANKIIKIYREQKIGNEEYHVNIPFVYNNSKGILQKAIKPINFDLKETTKIIETGDKWKSRIDRLRDMNCFPKDMLFVVKKPELSKTDVFIETTRTIKEMEVNIIADDKMDEILAFAK